MKSLVAPPGWPLLALSAAVLLAFALGSSGPFNLDEVIYLMGMEAARSGGGVVIENGHEDFGSDALRVWFLIPGPQGLVSQYPVGSAFAGALLHPLFGTRALMALNVAAALGTLFVTHALAMTLFRSHRVATIAVVVLGLFTFWPEYVTGHWPHAVSVFCTTLALLMFLRALPRETGVLLPATLSGLAIGAGMLFRLDGFLLAPAVAVMTILWAARPVRVLLGGALGLVPMIVALAASNQAKFGAWNPLSYGASGGSTDLSGHAWAAGLMLAALAGLVLLRLLPPAGPRFWRIGAVAGALGAALLLLTPFAPHIWRLVDGVSAILLDATTIEDPRPGVKPQPDGTLLFWGLPKKALFQSLPWLGALVWLLGGTRGAPQRAVATVMIVSVVWTLPFIALSWHGGLGSNMRYLMPILPPLSALAAWVVVRSGEGIATAPNLLRLGGVVPLVVALLVFVAAPELLNRVHQVWSTWLFLAVLAVSLAAGLVARPALTRAMLVLVGAGVGLSLFLAASDIATGQARRASNAASARAIEAIPGPVIFHGPPETYASAIAAPDRLLALSYPPGGNGAFDTALVERACEAGYGLVMWAVLAGGTGLPADRFEPLELPGQPEGEDLVRLRCD